MAHRSHRFASAWPRGYDVLRAWCGHDVVGKPPWEYFAGHTQGNGLFKWTHYLDIYHRHLARFVGQPVHLAEVGVLGGGSLEMWREYLGDRCHIYGIDIQPDVRSSRRIAFSIFVGDQADRHFWAGFKEQVTGLDIVIDDGGTSQSSRLSRWKRCCSSAPRGRVHLRRYPWPSECLCSLRAATGLVNALNQACPVRWGETRCLASPIQQAVHSIHFYPFMLVIEKHLAPPEHLIAVTRGTEWPSYLPVATMHSRSGDRSPLTSDPAEEPSSVSPRGTE